MKRTFIPVSKLEVKRITATITMAVAGILFTFSNMSAEEYVPDNFQSETVVVSTTEEHPTLEADGNIVLLNNSDCSAKINRAFTKFCQTDKNAATLFPLCEFISSGLESLMAEKVSVDGDSDSGMLNVAFRLPDGIILSVTKRFDTMADDMVAFNIMHRRNIIVSDVMSIRLLEEYINNVQKRLA